MIQDKFLLAPSAIIILFGTILFGTTNCNDNSNGRSSLTRDCKCNCIVNQRSRFIPSSTTFFGFDGNYIYNTNPYSPFVSEPPKVVRERYSIPGASPSASAILVETQETKFYRKSTLGGYFDRFIHGSHLFLNNGCSKSYIISMDSKEIGLLPPRSHSNVNLVKGFHSFSARNKETNRIEQEFEFCIEEQGAADYYVINVGGCNSFRLENYTYSKGS